MINFNGKLVSEEEAILHYQNRGLRFGDALFEDIRVPGGKLVFWEAHYLRLMSSMRIIRMEIPMQFTMEYLESEILKTIDASGIPGSSAQVRLTVFREGGGDYFPSPNEISWLVEAIPLISPFFLMDDSDYEIELFKDFYVNEDLLSTLNSGNKLLQVAGSIYRKENGYNDCLLLNQRKMVVQALNANLFLVSGRHVKTPPLSDGCLNGIIRGKLLEIIGKLEAYTVEEASISPFDLQRADELFLTNSLMGIRSITQYRKARFGNEVAADLLGKLNALARLG